MSLFVEKDACLPCKGRQALFSYRTALRLDYFLQFGPSCGRHTTEAENNSALAMPHIGNVSASTVIHDGATWRAVAIGETLVSGEAAGLEASAATPAPRRDDRDEL